MYEKILEICKIYNRKKILIFCRYIDIEKKNFSNCKSIKKYDINDNEHIH